MFCRMEDHGRLADIASLTDVEDTWIVYGLWMYIITRIAD